MSDTRFPVIVVILMVAITVILAAVIAAFVFGMAGPEISPVAAMHRGNFIVEDKSMEQFAVKLLNTDGSPFVWAHATDLDSWNSLQIGGEYSCDVGQSSYNPLRVCISTCTEIQT
jgi:flagellar basal body-associated protein FliL